MAKVSILGIKIDALTMDEAVKTAEKWLSEEAPHVIFTPNPEIIMAAEKDEALSSLINSADMLTADGIGVVKAAEILGTPLPERVSGFDLTVNIISLLGKLGKSLYILGGKPGVAEKACENMKKAHPNLEIAGFHDGYFKDDEEIIAEISLKKPDFLLVCMGAPKQEEWIFKYKDRLNARILIGAGGSADVLAGEVLRAPDFFIRHNLEWLYRVVKGKRYARALNLFKFALKIFVERWK